MHRFATNVSKGSRLSSCLCRNPSPPFGLIALRRAVTASRRTMATGRATASPSVSAGLPADSLPADYQDTFLATAHRIADAAGAVTRRYFRCEPTWACMHGSCRRTISRMPTSPGNTSGVGKPGPACMHGSCVHPEIPRETHACMHPRASMSLYVPQGPVQRPRGNVTMCRCVPHACMPPPP